MNTYTAIRKCRGVYYFACSYRQLHLFCLRLWQYVYNNKEEATP